MFGEVKRAECSGPVDYTRAAGRGNSEQRTKNMSTAAPTRSPRVPLLLLLKSYFAVLNGPKKVRSANKLSKNNNNNGLYKEVCTLYIYIKTKNQDRFVSSQEYYNITSEVYQSKTIYTYDFREFYETMDVVSA